MDPIHPLPDVDVEQAAKAVDHATWLTGPERNDADRLGWTSLPSLGIDTEFVREKTYYPRPGLVQLSDGQQVWLLDPIDPEPPSHLRDALNCQGTLKILHSVGEDLEVLQLVTGTLPAPLFDTQIGAAMLGHPLQMRYEHLVEQCFGVALPGGQARSDWCQRPLSQSLLSYAAQDVIWLPRLQQLLAEKLDRLGRLAWLEEDCQRLLSSASASDTSSAAARVKGAGRLNDGQLARLEALAKWRLEEAKRRDLPKSFIIRDEHLLTLAETSASPRAISDAIQALPPSIQRRYKGTIETMLSHPPNGDYQRPSELIALSKEEQALVKELQQATRKVADELGVDPALLASRKALLKLIREERPDWVNGWRGQWLQPLLRQTLG